MDVLASVLLGIVLGTFTGLIPGIHVNNLCPMVLGLAAASFLSSMNLVALIVAMMVTHTFLCYIPSTFLGVPEAGTELSVLPAHRLVLEGKGYEVIRLTAFGCLGALLISVALAVPISFVFAPAYKFVSPHMHWLLIAVTVIMILHERTCGGMAWGIAIFLLSGFLGLLALDTNLLRGDAALLPLLSGLFGISVLLISATRGGRPPPQRDIQEKLDARSSTTALCAGTAAGVFTGIVPGIGPSQGTVLAQLATRSSGVKEFLIGVSAVNMAKAIFSFVALYTIGKARSGAAVAVGQLLPQVGLGELTFLLAVVLTSGGIAAILHLRLGRIAAIHISRVPYRVMCLAVVSVVAGLTVYYCGLIGLLVLAVATAIGLLPTTVHVKRTHCMGVIMVPCILYFSGAKDAVLAALGFS